MNSNNLLEVSRFNSALKRIEDRLKSKIYNLYIKNKVVDQEIYNDLLTKTEGPIAVGNLVGDLEKYEHSSVKTSPFLRRVTNHKFKSYIFQSWRLFRKFIGFLNKVTD